LKNLAGDAAFGKTLEEMRGKLDRWIAETGDRGQKPEPDSMYDSDMKVYLDSKTAAQDKILADNIALMKKWAAEGK